MISNEAVEAAGLKFRKKPVVIEAFRLGEAWPDWWAEKHGRNEVTTHNEDGRWRGGPDYALIHTLEGVMRAERGDWIIRGIQGELYPCKPDIFAATYEPAAPHMLSAPEGVSEAEKTAIQCLPSQLARLKREANWILKNAPEASRASIFDAANTVYVDAHTLLSALSEATERAGRMERERDEAVLHPLAERAWQQSCQGQWERANKAEFLLALALEGAREAQPWKLFYGDGLTLGEIAERLGGTIYNYSPWLAAPVYRAEARAQAAEAKVKEAGELLDAFGRMLNEDHDNLPDELVVSLTYDDTAYDDDLGGPNTLLGELFLRVFRNARSAARRWTEEASQGEGE